MNKIIIVGLISLLYGCSSVPNKTVGSMELDNNKINYNCDYSTSVNKKGGAFYKTDGPLSLPENVNDIMEPIPKLEKLNKFSNRPYEVLGQKFEPLTVLKETRQEGIGSWYGSRYHGQKTSSGEIYDMFKMTAASPILPILSYAKVTNLNNGRSVIVRVNDRGPFLKDRIIDLSFLAACRLGYAEKGSARVLVESIVP